MSAGDALALHQEHIAVLRTADLLVRRDTSPRVRDRDAREGGHTSTRLTTSSACHVLEHSSSRHADPAASVGRSHARRSRTAVPQRAHDLRPQQLLHGVPSAAFWPASRSSSMRTRARSSTPTSSARVEGIIQEAKRKRDTPTAGRHRVAVRAAARSPSVRRCASARKTLRTSRARRCRVLSPLVSPSNTISRSWATSTRDRSRGSAARHGACREAR